MHVDFWEIVVITNEKAEPLGKERAEGGIKVGLRWAGPLKPDILGAEGRF